uniref:Uncharacterized protein n=1 Tax=Oryza sativa subsp. japonica TaxID=39947 RepID=Q69Y14_ORYSJ|nr:hypothetical protein [Oryza sativa Japonica Group]BAD35313.1 hypothetical protein [Oryza sativa Japonica Group]
MGETRRERGGDPIDRPLGELRGVEDDGRDGVGGSGGGKARAGGSNGRWSWHPTAGFPPHPGVPQPELTRAVSPSLSLRPSPPCRRNRSTPRIRRWNEGIERERDMREMRADMWAQGHF